MKNTEVLIEEAKKILSQEHFSPLPKGAYNSKAGKHLRKLFMSNCLEEFGTPFTSRIAGYIAPGQKAGHQHFSGGSVSRSL
jgi:hypothetical protein